MLWAILSLSAVTALLTLSLWWRTASPTRNMKAIPTSSASESSTNSSTMMGVALAEMKDLALSLVQGRSQVPTTPTGTEPTTSERSSTYDYDQTPLSPGIVAVEQREADEALQERLQTERRVFEQRRRELEQQISERQAILTDLEASSPGPWNGQGEVGDLT